MRSHTDRTAPTVTGFRVSARAVDTRTGPATIRLRVDVRDDISGVTSVRVEAESAGRRVAPGGMAYDNLDADLTRSATHKNRWTGRAVVPTWAGTSEWTFTVGARDKRRHVRSLSTEKLAARGWQSTLRVTSRRDIVAPSLVALSFSPTSVDARDGDVRVAVTVRVTDTLSGPAAWLPVDFGFPWAAMELTSITGTAHDRTYHGYAVVSQCGIAQESTMRAEVHLSDAAGNRRDVTSDELAALGFATDLSVRQRDSRAPTLGLLSSVAAGDPLALRFSEPVIMTDPLGSLLRVVVDGSTASGSWECRDGSGSVVVCDAEGAAVISSTFTPTTAFASGDRIDVLPTASPPARIGIYDLDGVPLDEIDIQAQLP